MDERSILFLERKGVQVQIHNPKKASSDLVRNSDYIFALDVKVLMELNRTYPNATSKIKLLNFGNPKLRIEDPYQKNDQEYNLIMERIYTVCEELVLP